MNEYKKVLVNLEVEETTKKTGRKNSSKCRIFAFGLLHKWLSSKNWKSFPVMDSTIINPDPTRVRASILFLLKLLCRDYCVSVEMNDITKPCWWTFILFLSVLC